MDVNNWWQGAAVSAACVARLTDLLLQSGPPKAQASPQLALDVKYPAQFSSVTSAGSFDSKSTAKAVQWSNIGLTTSFVAGQRR